MPRRAFPTEQQLAERPFSEAQVIRREAARDREQRVARRRELHADAAADRANLASSSTLDLEAEGLTGDAEACETWLQANDLAPQADRLKVRAELDRVLTLERAKAKLSPDELSAVVNAEVLRIKSVGGGGKVSE